MVKASSPVILIFIFLVLFIYNRGSMSFDSILNYAISKVGPIFCGFNVYEHFK